MLYRQTIPGMPAYARNLSQLRTKQLGCQGVNEIVNPQIQMLADNQKEKCPCSVGSLENKFCLNFWREIEGNDWM